MKTKKALIKAVEELGQKIIKQGILFQNLAMSLENERNDLSLKEMKALVHPYLVNAETKRDLNNYYPD